MQRKNSIESYPFPLPVDSKYVLNFDQNDL
jgi:hypothetical protein